MSEHKRQRFAKNNARLVCTATCDGDIKFYPGEKEAARAYPNKLAEGSVEVGHIDVRALSQTLKDGINAEKDAELIKNLENRGMSAQQIFKMTGMKLAKEAGK